ncbi:MAG: hypothetical protein BroJett013_09330 [Alphaproteobacteria bacterium]|nr:MAG: hypothetical protein BroJett013_09330 [Alphaproteobacteria bacterium]
MFGDFFLIERDGATPTHGERLAFGETNGRNEAWLRDTLLRHPELIPVGDIDPAYGPLTPLCAELHLGAGVGRLDAAFINAYGRLTLVECKLWRNPQARREVVAQVLDYARAISRWSYSDLQRQVAHATGRTGNVPYELAKAQHPKLIEHDFVDATAAAMRAGRFLLLIAGDGIREDVGAMAELINNNAAMGFSFGMVEVALYGFADGALAIQPRAIAKTRLIERTVVVLRDRGGAAVAADLDEPSDQSVLRSHLGEGQKQAEYREWYKPILNMKFDDPDQEAPTLYWPNNVRVPLPWPKVWLTASSLASEEKCAVWLVEGGKDKPLSPLLEERREEIDPLLPAGSFSQPENMGVVFGCQRPWASFANEDEKKAWIAETLNTFVNVFRPLLKELKEPT